MPADIGARRAALYCFHAPEWYNSYMTTEEIQAVLDRVRTWPAERQEDAVRLLLTMEQEAAEPYILDEEEAADIDAALAEIERGEEPASEEEVQAVFNRYRRA